jgi:hypothetical protein
MGRLQDREWVHATHRLQDMSRASAGGVKSRAASRSCANSKITHENRTIENKRYFRAQYRCTKKRGGTASMPGSAAEPRARARGVASAGGQPKAICRTSGPGLSAARVHSGFSSSGRDAASSFCFHTVLPLSCSTRTRCAKGPAQENLESANRGTALSLFLDTRGYVTNLSGEIDSPAKW